MTDICHEAHQLFHSLPHHHFPFIASRIPNNGIYILFEEGEQAHGGDRIVRIGTHTGDDKLPSRLNEHFLKENKDRSIFRKNIGRALLNKDNDPFLAQWEYDLMSREARVKFGARVDMGKQKIVECQVTDYVRTHFKFVVIPVTHKDKRLWLESRLVSTVSRCSVCQASASWLGNYSPKEKIRESGLWQEMELYKQPLSLSEFQILQALL